MTQIARNIYDLVTNSITEYENVKGIELEGGWNWSMKQHLKRSFLYMNSQFLENNSDRQNRPFKNIVLPILNIHFRTEGFDVKDIELYIENPDEYYKSLLLKKYHSKWAVENEIDTFIDEMTESYVTYGGALIRKRIKNVKPEVVDLRTIAFCNQTDILAYPFAIRHEMSQAELRKASDMWGNSKYGATIDIETLIQKVKKENKKSIEIFEIHGNMPKEWLRGREVDNLDEKSKDVPQIQIISFYRNEDNERTGVTIFKSEEPDLPFKFIARDMVENRALGRGGVEELFDDQEFINANEIAIREMLVAASKSLYVSDDPQFKTRNNLSGVRNNQVFNLQEGRSLQQVDTYPRNLAVFNDSVERFWQHAQLMGSAPEPLMGETPNSGTPFKLYEAQQIEGKGMHQYRQGKLAVFMDEIYRDWVLPHFAKEASKEQVFMDELSTDELLDVVDRVITQKSNDFKKKMIIGLQNVDEELVENYKSIVKQNVIKKGGKFFFKILKDEMRNSSLKVMTNIAGKQKNLALLTDKLVNVLRQFIATPQIRQDPEMVKLVNVILESSGLSPIRFNPAVSMMASQMNPNEQAGSTQPIKEFSQNQQINE